MPATALKPHQTAILAAAVTAAVAYLVPFVHVLLLPLQYLNTHLHELCHAITAELTGGQALRIVVHGDGSGDTLIMGGASVLTNSAGYVGSAIIGATIVMISRTPKAAALTLQCLAAVLALGMIVWVRGDLVGIVSEIGWIAALVAISTQLKGNGLIYAAQFIGVQQCLASFQALFVVLQISAFTSYHSDAQNLQNATGIPAIVWAGAWCLLSVALVGASLRVAWRSAPAA